MFPTPPPPIPHLQPLEEAVLAVDVPGMAYEAHKHKSAARLMKAHACAEACHSLDTFCKHPSADSAEACRLGKVALTRLQQLVAALAAAHVVVADYSAKPQNNRARGDPRVPSL